MLKHVSQAENGWAVKWLLCAPIRGSRLPVLWCHIVVQSFSRFVCWSVHWFIDWL